MTMVDRLMIELIGQADAVAFPLRGPDWRAFAFVANRAALLARVQDPGLPCYAGGGRDEDRKAVCDNLTLAQEAGLLVATNDRSPARPLVKLTDEGHLWARQLVQPCWMRDAFNVCRAIALAVPDTARLLKVLVSERKTARVVGRDPRSAEALADLESWFLPAVVAGWARTRSTVPGEVYYGLTARGVEIVGTDGPPDGDSVYRPDALVVYKRARTNMRRRLREKRLPLVPLGEIGELPLRPDDPCLRN